MAVVEALQVRIMLFLSGMIAWPARLRLTAMRVPIVINLLQAVIILRTIHRDITKHLSTGFALNFGLESRIFCLLKVL